MQQDIYAFPAVFYRDGNVIGVRFPDLPGCNTCGDDEDDAMFMAYDALCGHLACLEDYNYAIPNATPIAKLKIKSGEKIFLIKADICDIREENKITAMSA